MTVALLIIDMQMEMQHRIDGGADCVNPDAPARISELAAAFRKAERPGIHIRHGDDDPASTMHPDAPGYSPMPCAEAQAGEAGFASTVRAGADLGFRMQVVRDAVIGFGLPMAGHPAQVIFDVTMGHLQADFARLVPASMVLAELPA